MLRAHPSQTPLCALLSACLLIATSVTLSACDDEVSPTPQAGGVGEAGVQGAGEAGVQGAGEAGAQVAGEAGAQVAGEAGAQVAGEAGATSMSCLWDSECPEGDCVEGECVEALGTCAIHAHCPERSSCFEGRCVRACRLDLDCPEGGMCVEGACLPTPSELIEGQPIPARGSATQLFVGVGVSDFDYPLGVSLGGFGARPGPRTPYAFSLGGSDSVWERQDVRAVALDHGERVTLLIRLPLPWSTDYLRSLIALELRRRFEEAGEPNINPLDDLIVFATHSHSQPARFWNLIPHLAFGTLGYGTFSESLSKAYAKSAARAAWRALEARAPARLGWALLDEADPERRIHSNRRSSASPALDDRLLALRVDDLEGQPLAAFVGFGVHGTHFMSPLVTGDAAGAIERLFSERLSQRYGREVPAIFINGNAGNISPRGDHLTQQNHGHVQALAALLWRRYEPMFQEISTEAQLPLQHKAWRVPVGYDQLGYGTDDVDFATPEGEPYPYGAFYCVKDELAEGEPSYQPDDLPCGLLIHSLYHAPILQLQKTVLSALRVGELILTTLPGEPTSGLGLTLASLVEDEARAAGLTGARSFNMGYAQDHHFYLLEAEDWFRGGYEASMGLWGWRTGEYMVSQASALAASLLGRGELTRYNVSPTWWPESTLTPDQRAPSAQPTPALVSSPSATLTRDQLAVMSWRGGDPAVDQPHVSLWREVEGTSGLSYEPARLPQRPHPLDDRGLESVTRYQGDFEGEHLWQSAWDLPLELATGRYKLRVEGQAEAPYVVESEPFELMGEGGLVIRALSLETGALTLKVSYLNAPSTDQEGPFERLKPTGHLLRLLSPLASPPEGDEGREQVLSELLQRPSAEALKPWRFVIGPPALSELRVELFEPSVSFSAQGAPSADAISSLTLTPTLSSCAFELVTSRGEQGAEVRQSVTAPCGALMLTEAQLEGLSSLIAQGAQLKVSDVAGSWALHTLSM